MTEEKAQYVVAESYVYLKPNNKGYVGRTPPADSRLVHRPGDRVSKAWMARVGLRSLKERKKPSGGKK